METILIQRYAATDLPLTESKFMHNNSQTTSPLMLLVSLIESRHSGYIVRVLAEPTLCPVNTGNIGHVHPGRSILSPLSDFDRSWRCTGRWPICACVLSPVPGPEHVSVSLAMYVSAHVPLGSRPHPYSHQYLFYWRKLTDLLPLTAYAGILASLAIRGKTNVSTSSNSRSDNSARQSPSRMRSVASTTQISASVFSK